MSVMFVLFFSRVFELVVVDVFDHGMVRKSYEIVG